MHDVAVLPGPCLTLGPHSCPQVATHDDDDDANIAFAPPNMRAHIPIVLHDAADVAALYEQKLSLEGASPKPCIVPGNALQLIDEDPSASRSHTPSSVIVLDDARSDSTPEPNGQQQNSALRPVPRVRFRSRVRITSGLRRGRHAGAGVGPTSSPSSSASGSPSSSISAPIRWQADEHAAWGPLGRRLSAYAHGNGWQKPSARQQLQQQQQAKIDERTPLIRPGRQHAAYVDAGADGGGEADDERAAEGELDDSDDETEADSALRAAALKREEEATFGKWPWRLFNRHVRRLIISCRSFLHSYAFLSTLR